MNLKRSKSFSNGIVYCFEIDGEYPIETTDTFLPSYTKDSLNVNSNSLTSYDLGSRNDRWMIGVSVMSGCPVKCKFCATGKLNKWRNLTADEIVEQVIWVVNSHKGEFIPEKSFEFKINYTRMGEPFLNIENVKDAIRLIDSIYSNCKIHHYISTVGVKYSDYSFIKDNITLQLSLHSLDSDRRNKLIPFTQKLTIEELGQIRTNSNLKTTLNLTLVDKLDFDIELLKKYFDKSSFFIKLSPINENEVSESNHLGSGIIQSVNLI